MPDEHRLDAARRRRARLVAGAIGTALMTVAQELTAAKLQGSGDDGEQQGPEQSQPQDPWQQASAPAKVAKRISAVYGLAQGTIHAPTLRHGLLFGTGVWAMSYVELVPMGLYELPWKTRRSPSPARWATTSSTARRPRPRTRSSIAGRSPTPRARR
jgi:hypothetical protein